MFAQRLQNIRQEKKLTMTELASLTNTTKNTIWNYENGVSKAPQDMLIKLADVLGVSTDYLLGRSEHPYPSTQLSEKEIFILNEIKGYPDLYDFLVKNPSTNAEKIYLLWALIQNEFVKRDG